MLLLFDVFWIWCFALYCVLLDWFVVVVWLFICVDLVFSVY